MDTTFSSRRARLTLRSRLRMYAGVALVVGACLFSLVALLAARHTPSRSSSLDHPHRHLAANTTDDNDTSCPQLAPWEEQFGIILYSALLLYVFIALAIVCDDYFVASLEKISEALSLSSDVAGATFMAAGSSAPELFVSLADNVFAKPTASLGIGTIVGSAIFNILIIIALSALLAGQVLALDWRPLLRDSLWYCWSIVALTYTIWDGKVDVVESVVLFASYILYCVYMSQNERIIRACCRRPTDDEADETVVAAAERSALDAAAEAAAQLVDGNNSSTSQATTKRAWTIDVERVQTSATTTEDHAPHQRLARQSSTGNDVPAVHAVQHPHRLGSQAKLNPMFRSKYRMFQYHPHLAERSASGRMLEVDTTSTLTSLAVQPPIVVSQSPSASKKTVDQLDGDEEPLGSYFEELFDVPSGVLRKLWFALTFPIVLAMRLTIPDCRYPQFRGTCGFTATFTLAVAWIALLSHFTVLWASKLGCLAGIPPALMGLTIIAAGTSVPDALSSVLVARDGHGDMAVSNAIGSNVFDILLGLGLPFFLSNLVYDTPVHVVVDDLELSLIILFGVLLAVILLLLAARWRLHPVSGAIMVVLYAAYVVFSYLRGLGQI